MKYEISCLDTWPDKVKEVLLECAPREFNLRFAESYEFEHQAELVRNADAILPGFARVTEELLQQTKRLKIVHKWGIGVDRIDVAAVHRRGILLAITSGANAHPVAELAIALMLAVYRRIYYNNVMMRLGKWPKDEMRETCFQLYGKKIGIVGFGNIGRKLAMKLRGFEADIVYFDPARASPEVEQSLDVRWCELDELIETCDIVSLHLPVNEKTRGMLDAKKIASMKQGAMLINTARGELIDEDALFKAVRDRHLLGAGLDAFDPEPVARGSQLLALNEIVVIPHGGGGVLDNVANVGRHAFGNMQKVFEGKSIDPSDLIV